VYWRARFTAVLAHEGAHEPRSPPPVSVGPPLAHGSRVIPANADCTRRHLYGPSSRQRVEFSVSG